MAKRGVLKGDKVSNSHSTFNELAGEVIKASKKMDDVKKIALGPIKSVSSAKRRITVRDDKGQSRVQCRDHNSVQILWVIGVDHDVLQKRLDELL